MEPQQRDPYRHIHHYSGTLTSHPLLILVPVPKLYLQFWKEIVYKVMYFFTMLFIPCKIQQVSYLAGELFSIIIVKHGWLFSIGDIKYSSNLE